MTNQPNDGGPAFPTMDNSEHYRHMGLSLRDYFAAAALTGLLSYYPNFDCDDYAADAYKLADEMLKAREAKP